MPVNLQFRQIELDAFGGGTPNPKKPNPKKPNPKKPNPKKTNPKNVIMNCMRVMISGKILKLDRVNFSITFSKFVLLFSFDCSQF